MSDKILDNIEKRIEIVDGSLLSVVEDPFRFPTYYHAVYLAKTDKRAFAGFDKITGGQLSILELDTWMTGILNGTMGAIWPIAHRSIVNVLYRDESFHEIAIQAQDCVTARFFDPDKFSPWTLQPMLSMATKQGLKFTEMKTIERLVKEHFMRYGTAIHFLRTGDLETDYDVLKGHFYVDDLNILELTENRLTTWTSEIADKMTDLYSELKGAQATSKINWEMDMSDLSKLGMLVMQLRTSV